MSELLQISPSWSRRAGACFGVREASLAGVVIVEDAGAQSLGPALHAVEAALVQLVDEPLPATPAGQSADERLVTLHTWLQCAIQRQSRIALTTVFHVQRQERQHVQEPVPAGASTFHVCLPAATMKPARIAMAWATRLFNRLASGQAPDAARERDAIHEELKEFANPGLNTFNVLSAAHELDVPVQVVAKYTLVLGTGARSRWMESSLTDATPAIGMRMANSKHTTARVLRAAGLPGGDNHLVKSAHAAMQAAHQLGYPVVVKPMDLQQGTGVSADLRDDAAVAQGFALARDASPNVLVEKWAPGFTHRLTVFNGRVIRVTRRIAGGVFGDGVTSVAALVQLQQQNALLQRGMRRTGRVLLELDAEAHDLLLQHGKTAADVPRAGEYVRLRRRDNVSAGGTNESVPLQQTHPDNLQLAVDAAALLRLDFAGVDLIMEDIRQSWFDTGALICEVNGQPQLGTSSEPKIYHQILRELLGDDCRIPARLLICTDGDAPRELALQRLLREGESNGISSPAGLWIDGRLATGPFADGFAAAQALLRRTDVRNATCLMTISEVDRMGLPLAQWDRIDMVNRAAMVAHDAVMVTRVTAMARPHQAMRERA
ncbi:cyanophycin synthetase [Caenimonas koreensis DSM 17982]|uniref:Cyanophycin synthetase n=1 Tax=Caenimonas koreensis DSM 17982 TaxID=1121255 RepID=A0A844ASP4_9BURK|nr:acetate--CoA ligase family protein [Caenimonas koreensis]MRD47345.1 cyanophycin synthetase [Caenimonas koreensis DSM 17982]